MSRALTKKEAQQQQLQQQQQYARDVETHEHHARADASVSNLFNLPWTYRDHNHFNTRDLRMLADAKCT